MRGWKAYLKVAAIVLAFCLIPFGGLAFSESGKSAASFIVTPVEGTPKGAITFYGAGFVPGEVIEIIMVVDGVPSDLGRKPMIKKANESGAFKFKGNIPRNAATGVHTIEAVGDKGTVAVAPLEVVKKKK